MTKVLLLIGSIGVVSSAVLPKDVTGKSELEVGNHMNFPDSTNIYDVQGVIRDTDGWIDEDKLPNYDPNDPNIELNVIVVSGDFNGVSVEEQKNGLSADVVTCEQITNFCTGLVSKSVDRCKFFGGWTAGKGEQLYSSVKKKLLADDKKVLKDIAAGFAQGIATNFPNYFINTELNKVFVDSGYPQTCATKDDLDALEQRILHQFDLLRKDIIGQKHNQGDQGYCDPNANVAQQHGEGNKDGNNQLTATLTANTKVFKTQPHSPAPCSVN